MCTFMSVHVCTVLQPRRGCWLSGLPAKLSSHGTQALPTCRAVPAIGSARRWWCAVSARQWWVLRRGLGRERQADELWGLGLRLPGRPRGLHSADTGLWASSSESHPLCPLSHTHRTQGHCRRAEGMGPRPKHRDHSPLFSVLEPQASCAAEASFTPLHWWSEIATSLVTSEKEHAGYGCPSPRQRPFGPTSLALCPGSQTRGPAGRGLSPQKGKPSGQKEKETHVGGTDQPAGW